MHVKEALGNILENKLDLMRENFESALVEKAIQKLEERKIKIAETYFGEEKSPAKKGEEAAEKDDESREKHMKSHGKLPKRLTGELAMKMMKKKKDSED